jgi:RNA recognition motif-containing protein
LIASKSFGYDGSNMGDLNSYNVTAEELFDLFGKFGPIR